MDPNDSTPPTDPVSNIIVARTGLTPDRLNTYLQTASTAIIGFIGACYAAGYAVVNIRLSKFGVYTPGFARAEHVLAGATFLIFLGIAHVSLTYSAQIFAYARASPTRFAAVKGFAVGLIVLIAPVWLVLSRVAGPGLTWSKSLLTCGFMVGVVASYTNIRGQWAAMRPSPTDTSSGPYRLAFVRLMYFSTIVTGVLGITAYAHYVYPQISTTFGGGKHAPVVLLVTNEGALVAQQLVLPVSINNKLVGPVEPLTETDAEIVLLTQGSQGFHPEANAVRLKKEYVEAVINLSRRD
jgi:hypothetical protein